MGMNHLLDFVASCQGSDAIEDNFEDAWKNN